MKNFSAVSCRFLPAIRFFLFLFIATAASAGTKGKIAGKVMDANTKQPLFGANVVIKGTAMGAITDNNGEYFIINIHPGTYAVAFSFIGYESVSSWEYHCSIVGLLISNDNSFQSIQ